jgi:hypothetical protein
MAASLQHSSQRRFKVTSQPLMPMLNTPKGDLRSVIKRKGSRSCAWALLQHEFDEWGHPTVAEELAAMQEARLQQRPLHMTPPTHCNMAVTHMHHSVVCAAGVPVLAAGDAA